MQSLTKGFGITGLILIFFGVVALAITKLMNWYVYVHFGLGLGLIVLYFVFNMQSFRERMRERSTTEGSKVLVYAGVVVAIMILLHVVSFRYNWRWDLTANKVFSLEDQTLKTLANLKSPVQVTAFLHSKNNLRDPFKQLIGTYAFRSKNVRFEIIDPDKKPDMAAQLQLKDGDLRFVYGLPDKTYATFDEKALREDLKERLTTIYYIGASLQEPAYEKLRALLNAPEFRSKGVRLEVLKPGSVMPPGVDLREPRAGTLYVQFARKDTVIRTVSEEAFTNAILQVARQSTPIVRFAVGHGERSLDEEDERGYSVLKGAIQNEGYEVLKIESSLVQGVPAGTDILVLAGALSAYSKEEADSLDRYLEAGGKLIILADPNISNPKLNKTVGILDSGLETMLDKWGVVLGKDIILEKHLQLFAGQTTEPIIMARDYGDHEIVALLKDQSTQFNIARSVKRSAKAAPDIKVTELVRSAPGTSSWAETNINDLILRQTAVYDGSDTAGQVPVAVAVERNKPGIEKQTRLVVFGDADFVSNSIIRSHEANYDLFLNALNWQWGRQEQISIRAKQLRSSKLLLSPEQTNVIFYASVLTIPELVLIIGLAIYWRRKSR